MLGFILDVWVDRFRLGQACVGHERPVRGNFEVVVFEGDGEAPKLPDAHFVAFTRTPTILFASCSVKKFIFSVLGGLIIVSRGRSSMLSLPLSLISEEREKGAIPEVRIESLAFRVARTFIFRLMLLFRFLVTTAEHSSTRRYCY